MLLDLLFPRECVGCRTKGSYLCADCKKTLYAHPEICPFCHKASEDFQVCAACKAGESALEGIVVGFAYQNLMKKLILKVKFGHKKDVVSFLAERLALLIQVNGRVALSLEPSQLFLSFVPSHRRRKYLEKGYNQSELLAKELANQLGLPIVALAKKWKYTVSQLKLNRAERTKNLKEAFRVQQMDQLMDQLPPRATVLFVDDVTTTGSTLLELAKVVKKQRQDVTIWGAVLARNMG